jgi:hypothetical protein
MSWKFICKEWSCLIKGVIPEFEGTEEGTKCFRLDMSKKHHKHHETTVLLTRPKFGVAASLVTYSFPAVIKPDYFTLLTYC